MTIEPGTDMSEDRLFNLGYGLIYRSVCAPASWTADQVADAATKEDPPRTSANRWVVTEPDEEMPDNPRPCNDCADRRHWRINC